MAPFVSWWGSYQQLQGTYTFISYVILRRAADHGPICARPTISAGCNVWSSSPVCPSPSTASSSIMLDPLPWGGDVTARIAANAGAVSVRT
ncbi:MAG: hypothetical protein R2854_24035 [Caldilineaceae bacterium]